MLSKAQISEWFLALELGGDSARRWGITGIFVSLIGFAIDLLFAVTLQRFFISIGLVDGAAGDRFLGPIVSASNEMLIFITVGIFRSLVIWLSGVATGVSQVAFETTVRTKICQWAIEEKEVSGGRAATLFNDIVVCSGSATSTAYYLCGRILVVSAFLIALFIYSTSLTFFVLLAVILIMPLHKWIDRSITTVSTYIQRSLSNTTDKLLRTVKNKLYVHIHGLVEVELVGHSEQIDAYGRNSKKYYFLSSLRGVIPQMAGVIVVAIIAFQGGKYFSTQSGILVAYLFLVMRFFQSLAEIARVTANIRGNWPRIRVLGEWYRESYLPHQACTQKKSIEGKRKRLLSSAIEITFQDVSYGWTDGNLVLKNANFVIPQGSITAITGPSGAGKTTCLLLLTRLLSPTSGEIRITSSKESGDLRDVIEDVLAVTAYVGPDPFVITGTVRDNLLYGNTNEVDDDTLHEILDRAHCSFVFERPEGLDEQMTEQGGGFSAGQKQRLAIARALLREPAILLLDEATSNLDIETEKAIVTTLEEVRGATTIIMVTHRGMLMTMADQTLTMKGDGAIVCG